MDNYSSSASQYATLSQNGTLEVVQNGIPTLVNYSSCLGPFSDIQQGQGATSDPLLLALNPTGQVCRFTWSASGGSTPQIEVDTSPPFSGLAGGPPVELPGQYRSQWALDTFGAIWETHDTSPGAPSLPVTWTNYTDPGTVNDGFRPILVRKSGAL